MNSFNSRAWQRRQSDVERPIPHVLLAEDDSDFRALLAQAFRRSAYDVTECVDGPDLVSKLGAFVLFGPPAGRPPATFDIVISDIRMPGATALEVLEAMRECAGVPPVILITAFPSDDTLDAAHRLGVAAVFNKPFEIDHVITKADELVARRHSARP